MVKEFLKSGKVGFKTPTLEITSFVFSKMPDFYQ